MSDRDFHLWRGADTALLALLDALPDPHCLVTRDGAPMAANTAAIEHLQRYQAAASRTPFAALTPVDALERIKAGKEVVISPRTADRPGLKTRLAARPFGSDALMIHLTPLPDTPDRPASEDAAEDVGALVRAHRLLEAHTEALERSNRELNRFATVAAHDMQEPLRKISAFASLLRRRYEGALDSDAQHSLDYLVDAAARMRSLIDDLLSYSRVSTGPLAREPLDLQILLADILEVWAPEIEKAQARIEHDAFPSLSADPALLRQVFDHLLSNALKFRKGEGVQIRFRVREDGAFWRFDVIDDGIGFDPKFKDKVFAPFGRLHHRETYGGNGVGLALCQQVIERHGGHIEVDSAEGMGATFSFTLPRA